MVWCDTLFIPGIIGIAGIVGICAAYPRISAVSMCNETAAGS